MEDTMVKSARVIAYRPISKAEFSRYAKNFSWLIQLPLQRSQELLARAYGYRDYYGLRADLMKGGEPGPFDCNWSIPEGRGDIPHVLPNVAGRRERLQELLEQTFDEHEPGAPNVSVLTTRQADALDIGLFDIPPIHRQLVKTMRQKYELA